MKLKKLLNRLMELGWKPWDNKKIVRFDSVYYSLFYQINNGLNNDDGDYIEFSINDLCSIDSGLWQFVCGLDKGFLPFCSKCNIKLESNNDNIKGDTWYEEEYQYRLMLSSIQEDKEKFLLDNIKLPYEQTTDDR